MDKDRITKTYNTHTYLSLKYHVEHNNAKNAPFPPDPPPPPDPKR